MICVNTLTLSVQSPDWICIWFICSKSLSVSDLSQSVSLVILLLITSNSLSWVYLVVSSYSLRSSTNTRVSRENCLNSFSFSCASSNFLSTSSNLNPISSASSFLRSCNLSRSALILSKIWIPSPSSKTVFFSSSAVSSIYPTCCLKSLNWF